MLKNQCLDIDLFMNGHIKQSGAYSMLKLEAFDVQAMRHDTTICKMTDERTYAGRIVILCSIFNI
ncbi:hypothetical protein JF55_15545 [Pseudomonas sp. 1-7]|nr:hypothetical protein JF55_15545 [Pseudomonas sp. 1-7]